MSFQWANMRHAPLGLTLPAFAILQEGRQRVQFYSHPSRNFFGGDLASNNMTANVRIVDFWNSCPAKEMVAWLSKQQRTSLDHTLQFSQEGLSCGYLAAKFVGEYFKNKVLPCHLLVLVPLHSVAQVAVMLEVHGWACIGASPLFPIANRGCEPRLRLFQ